MRAAFFDRDGTINIDYGHVFRPEDLDFVPGAPEYIKRFNDWDIPVIVVTNQAGIAKGLYTEEQMHQFHRYMNERLQREYGAHIDAFYFCPHHPDYTGPCDCRKPMPGMLLRAAKDMGIDLAASDMFGDTEKDRLAAAAAGIGRYHDVREERGFYESCANAENSECRNCAHAGVRVLPLHGPVYLETK